MTWTRHPVVLGVGLLAATALVAMNADERGFFFWLGVGLFFGNAVTLGARLTRRAEDSGAVAGLEELGRAEVTLADLLVHPDVQRELDRLPSQWPQISHLSDDFGPVDVSDMAPWVYLQSWGADLEVSLADDAWAYVDLEVDPDDDPILHALASHPAVEDAWHEDREVYGARVRAPLPLPEFGVLVARGLVGHQLRATGGPSAR